MALKMTILPLLVLIATVASHPFRFGVNVGANSKLGGEANAGGNAGVGVDHGVTGGAKGKADVGGSWIKSVHGAVYAANEDGKGIGLKTSLGSDLGAKVNGTVGVGGDTNIVSSHGGGRTGLDADVHYNAGGEIDFLSRDELKKTYFEADKIHGSRSDCDCQDCNCDKPKYSQWID